MAKAIVNRRLNIYIDQDTPEQKNEFKIRSIVTISKPTAEGYDNDQYEKARVAFIEAFDHLMFIGCEITLNKLNQKSGA
jgi:hypothetical protein